MVCNLSYAKSKLQNPKIALCLLAVAQTWFEEPSQKPEQRPLTYEHPFAFPSSFIRHRHHSQQQLAMMQCFLWVASTYIHISSFKSGSTPTIYKHPSTPNHKWSKWSLINSRLDSEDKTTQLARGTRMF